MYAHVDGRRYRNTPWSMHNFSEERLRETMQSLSRLADGFWFYVSGKRRSDSAQVEAGKQQKLDAMFRSAVEIKKQR